MYYETLSYKQHVGYPNIKPFLNPGQKDIDSLYAYHKWTLIEYVGT